MLWYKFWLETRSRAIFMVLLSGAFLLVLLMSKHRAGAGGAVLSMPLVFGFLFLAETGIRTQPGLGETGFAKDLLSDKSVLYTLSLPVSRRRLLLVRAAVGLIETAVLGLISAFLAWSAHLLGDMSLIGILGYSFKIFVWGIGFYCFSTFFSTFLADFYLIWAIVLIPGVLFNLAVFGLLPKFLNIFSPISSSSLTGTLPWLQMAASIILGGILLLASIKIVESQEY